jgi:hypothetical protein
LRRGLGRILDDQDREQHGLEQDEGLDPARLRERRLEGDRTAIRVADEMESVAGRGKDGGEQRRLVRERQRPVIRPCRAPAGAVQVDRERAKAIGEAIHQRPPLGRGTCARMNADDRGTAARLAKERAAGLHHDRASAVVGSITPRTSETRLHGKPPRVACSLIRSGLGAM